MTLFRNDENGTCKLSTKTFEIMQCLYMVYTKIVRNKVKNSDTNCELFALVFLIFTVLHIMKFSSFSALSF